ncbi:hypothetical protein [[Pseudomonas] boreopolis]|uniref:Uncharacterized protein n=1 Tax=Xanthomonas boreopolis TaxID=86183 RepID=A0A919F8X9_9XANT|nr:hypothetical protein GCM10009090_25360 [[Pseudomonas] boreopolis]
MPAMPLDPRLRWTRRSQYDEPGTALELDGEPVACLLERIDGGWIARLEVQRSMSHPLVTRRCSSKASGRRGCEMWAMRHLDRLTAEVAQVKANKPARRWCARSE